MSDRVRQILLIVITTVWVLNQIVLPIVLEDYLPDPSINAVFAIAAAAVFGARRKEKNGE